MLGHLRNRDWEASIYLLLAVASLAIGCFLIYTSPVDMVADVEQYYEIAKALVGKGGELYYTRSSWGYPLLLIFTGFPWTHWPVITQVVQVGMAAAIPYFVGSTLRLVGVGPWLRVSAAVASFLILPVVFAVSLLTNTYSEFLLYVAIWLIAWALARVEGAAVAAAGRTRWKLAAGLGAAFFLLYLVRAENILLGFVALGAAVATAATAARGVMLRAVCVLIALMLAWVPLQRGWTAWAQAKTSRTFVTDGSWAGLLFFKNIYSGGSTFVGHSAIRPQNGRCSSQIYAAVEKNIGTIGNVMTARYNRPITTDEVFTVHDNISLGVIWKSVEHDFGPRQMDRIFWCAAFEAIWAEPKSLLYYYDTLVGFFLLDDLIYDSGVRRAWPSVGPITSANDLIWAWALYAGTTVKVASFLIALATVVPAWRRGGPPRVLAVTLWAIILYIAVIYVAFASADWRYTEPVIPALVLLAGLGLEALRAPVELRPRQSVEGLATS